VTNISSEVLKADVLKADVLKAGVLTAEPWRARLGACCPRSTFPGTSVPGAGGGTGLAGTGLAGTGLAVVVRQVPRVRDKAGLATPVPQSALVAQLGQINNDNHMTSVYAVGEGASGPPPHREPA
jgi:hypothetical protein